MKKSSSIIALAMVPILLFGSAYAVNGIGAAKADTKKESNTQSKATTTAIAKVEAGSLMGYFNNGVYSFKGVPYAEAERFMMPQKIKPWTGVRPALVYGETFPNGQTNVNSHEFMTPSNTDMVPNENSQFLNVWTKSIKKTAKKPVVFFIHGGGFTSGSSNELPYYDGENLTKSGNVVFVSVNHRLNALGYLDLSAYGEKYKYSGNVGMADIVAALQWVKDNINQFGGDPNNVTIVGQSGGASKVLTLMGMPEAKGLFQKAVAQSGGVAGKDQKTSREQAAKLLNVLGLTPDKVDELQKIPYDQLLAAANQAKVTFEPVVDGDYYPAKTINDKGEFTSISKSVPLIVSTVFSEFTSNFEGLQAGKFQDNYMPGLTDKRVMELLKQKYGTNADKVAVAFKKAYPTHKLADVLFIWPRNNNIALAKAKQNGAPVYQDVFAWDFPIFGGVTNWHTGGDIPFFFNNIDKIDYMVAGDEKKANELANEASATLVNFAYQGDPNSKGVAKWSPFTQEAGSTMIFDRKSETRNYHDAKLMKLISEGVAK